MTAPKDREEANEPRLISPLWYVLVAFACSGATLVLEALARGAGPFDITPNWFAATLRLAPLWLLGLLLARYLAKRGMQRILGFLAQPIVGAWVSFLGAIVFSVILATPGHDLARSYGTLLAFGEDRTWWAIMGGFALIGALGAGLVEVLLPRQRPR
jgi:hypothetical protein